MLADQGSDVNVIPQHILADMKRASPDLVVRQLETPRSFDNANMSATAMTCARSVQVDVEVRIRHGQKLMLRKVKWLVADTELAHAYIGRHVLDALGLNNRALLAAARDRLGGVVDVSELLADAGLSDDPCADGATTIASILRDHTQQWGSTFHSEGGFEDDNIDSTKVYVDLGEDSDAELDAALRSLVTCAIESGLDSAHASRLSDLLTEYRSIFRLRLGKSKPADVTPMEIRLLPNQRPIRVKARRYTAEQRAFLDQYVDALRKMGFVKDMPTATWQAAPLLVPKRDSKAPFRMAVDLRPVNSATEKEAWPMPHLESELQDFAGSEWFALLDFVSGYWQLPLHPNSYALCGIVTPHGVVASTRVLPGLANATAFFQRSVEPLFAELRDWLKAWLDDFCLHANDAGTLLSKLEVFFKICKERRLYLHARKCRFFDRKIKWCGRIITGEGFQMDPARLAGLQDIALPQTAEELAQFLYCCRWMSQVIPDFVGRIIPLTEILDSAYARSGRRTNRSIRAISLQSLSWGPTHERVFLDLQESLRNSVQLAHPDPKKSVCVLY